MNAFLLLAVTISWSVFHPVWPDVDYFKRIIAKADACGGVDSFEACGRCGNPNGGLNGFLLYEPYPSAAKDVDRAWVAKNVETMNEVVERHAAHFQDHLPDDTLMLIDNHHTLHGRTTYEDEARHLIRIRISDVPNAERIGPSGVARD